MADAATSTVVLTVALRLIPSRNVSAARAIASATGRAEAPGVTTPFSLVMAADLTIISRGCRWPIRVSDCSRQGQPSQGYAMSRRLFTVLGVAAVLVAAVLLVQCARTPSAANATGGTGTPATPWGEPDLQGIWTKETNEP